MTLARHLDAIRTIDARAEREAKRIRETLAQQERKFKANHWEPARKAAKAIEKSIRARLRPHRVEYGHVEAWHINYLNMTVHPSFSLEIWPHKPGANRFATQARAHIKATITPRNEAELLHAIAGIKMAATVLAEMLFTPPPKEDGE
jgi:hypothetical protein